MEINNRLGYACINITLNKLGIRTSRDVRKKTFIDQGISIVSKLALENIKDLYKIIEWNIQNNIHFYRISSSIIPWMSEVTFADFPDYDEIVKNLKAIGQLSRANNQRLEFHPSHFCSLSSVNEKTILTSINDLNNQSLLFDLMDYPADHNTNLNIHIGNATDGKIIAVNRWHSNFKRLAQNTQARIVVENDDKGNLYSVKDLHYLYELSGVPITFDIFHWNFCTGNQTPQEAQLLAASTWDTQPVMHYSSSRKNMEDSTAKQTMHADWIHEIITDHDTNSWIMCESKMKEISLIKYKTNAD